MPLLTLNCCCTKVLWALAMAYSNKGFFINMHSLLKSVKTLMEAITLKFLFPMFHFFHYGLFIIFCFPRSHSKLQSFSKKTLTLIATSRPHAGFKVLGVWARHTEVQLGLQHPLPHPLALFTSGRAAGWPWRPVGVDAGLRSIICRMESGV